MGASAGQTDKKSVDVILNLVPFIDLLSVLICFLLMTAVWQQIDVISTNTSSTAAADPNDPPPPQKKKVDLSVTILQNGLEAAEGTRVTKIANYGGEPNFSTLAHVLIDWKKRHPDRKDVIVYSDSKVAYRRLITLMDTLMEYRFEDIGVNTN